MIHHLPSLLQQTISVVPSGEVWEVTAWISFEFLEAGFRKIEAADGDDRLIASMRAPAVAMPTAMMNPHSSSCSSWPRLPQTQHRPIAHN